MPEEFESNSGKEILWEQRRQEVEKIVDRLGKKIEGEIKEAVAAFRVSDFPTDGSCEGHIRREGEKKHGLPYPWVDICAPAPEGWQESKEKQMEWKKENLVLQQRMEELLSDFYRERETSDETRLGFKHHRPYGNFRLQSSGAETFESEIKKGNVPFEEQQQKLDVFRKEMNDLAEFLKQKYFAE